MLKNVSECEGQTKEEPSIMRLKLGRVQTLPWAPGEFDLPSEGSRETHPCGL